MDDAEFQGWVRQIATVDLGAPPPSPDAIWWRAQLRRRLAAEERATRPIRIANGAACIACWVLAAAVLTHGRGDVVAVFVAMTAAIVAGVRATVLKKI